jgi:hypothetical protein
MRLLQGRSLQLFAAFLFLLAASVGPVFAQQPSPPSSRPPENQVPAALAPDPGTGVSRTGHEDWSSLSLAGSDLHAEEPFLAERDEDPAFTRELIQVKWRAGDPIDLYVIRPRGVEKPPAILYLYSYPSETERFQDDGFCRRTTKDGFAAIGFVSALNGHRYHTRPMREWFVSELQEALVTSTHDVQMVLNYLSQRGDFDMNRIGMFGEGSGATIAILAAAVDKRIKALDLLDPWGDWPDWMAKSSLIPEQERANYVKPEFLKRVEPFDPLRWLPHLESRQVRIQHVLDDTVTPKLSKQAIEAAALPSVQIVRYDDTRALFDASSGGRLFLWIKEQLRAPAPPGGLKANVAPATTQTNNVEEQ